MKCTVVVLWAFLALAQAQSMSQSALSKAAAQAVANSLAKPVAPLRIEVKRLHLKGCVREATPSFGRCGSADLASKDQLR